MFSHPDQCFLSDEDLKKARYLDLKFAKAFLVERLLDNGNMVKMIKAVLYTRTGLRFSSALMPAPGLEDDLQRWVEAHLDDTYRLHVNTLVQRLQTN